MAGEFLTHGRVTAQLAVVLAAVVAQPSGAMAASTRARPEIISLAGGLDPLKAAFAANDGRPRYLALVSPT